jgi:hypothetical protein
MHAKKQLTAARLRRFLLMNAQVIEAFKIEQKTGDIRLCSQQTLVGYQCIKKSGDIGEKTGDMVHDVPPFASFNPPFTRYVPRFAMFRRSGRHV